MATLVRAKYDNLVTPVGQWEKAFRSLLSKVHARTRRFRSREIERGITLASRRAHKR